MTHNNDRELHKQDMDKLTEKRMKTAIAAIAKAKEKGKRKFSKRCSYICKDRGSDCAFDTHGGCILCVQDVISNNINPALMVLADILKRKEVGEKQIKLALKGLRNIVDYKSFIGSRSAAASKSVMEILKSDYCKK